MPILQELTGHQIESGNFDKVILAVGSCENHGDHLPHGTDTFVSYEIAKAVASAVPGLLVLPPVNVGMSEHYSYFPFAVSLRAETLVAVLEDILQSVLRNGITKIFVLNGHDGNIAPIEIATRSIKMRFPQAKIATLDAWWVTAGKLLPQGTFEVWDGLGHAGEGETSICLELFPHLVQMEHARGVVPDLPPHVDIKWNFAELTNCGATGDPTKATAAKGKKMAGALIATLISFFRTMEDRGWDYSSPEAARP